MVQQSAVEIALIHATMNSVGPIVEAFRDYAPQVRLLHYMDEGLISELNRTGVVSPAMVRRLASLMERAENSSADGLLLTCSSFTPYVQGIKHLFAKPVLSADYSMLEQAVERGRRIGVIATVGAAGPTTTKLLYEIAAREGKVVEVETTVLTEAFHALQQGDPARHDELIEAKVHDVAARCDLVVLAQFSMVRALKRMKLPDVPVLTSPEISIKAMLSLLEGRAMDERA